MKTNQISVNNEPNMFNKRGVHRGECYRQKSHVGPNINGNYGKEWPAKLGKRYRRRSSNKCGP